MSEEEKPEEKEKKRSMLKQALDPLWHMTDPPPHKNRRISA